MSTGWRTDSGLGRAVAGVDYHLEALAKINRLFMADDPGVTLRTVEAEIVVTIRGNRPIVQKVVVPHLLVMVRETVSTAGAA